MPAVLPVNGQLLEGVEKGSPQFCWNGSSHNREARYSVCTQSVGETARVLGESECRQLSANKISSA